MNPKPIEQAGDADLRGASAALRRAADAAARIAQQTGTQLITVASSSEAAKSEACPESKAGESKPDAAG